MDHCVSILNAGLPTVEWSGDFLDSMSSQRNKVSLRVKVRVYEAVCTHHPVHYGEIIMPDKFFSVEIIILLLVQYLTVLCNK